MFCAAFYSSKGSRVAVLTVLFPNRKWAPDKDVTNTTEQSNLGRDLVFMVPVCALLFRYSANDIDWGEF
jgi:hypothetical protein